MTFSAVEVFLRAKPVRSPTSALTVNSDDRKAVFRLPRDVSLGHINNQREVLEFSFSDVFDPQVQQEQVFSHVARKIVLAALDGVNGTVFAYGQTGSGKTFTMTGGAERYVDRGIIPRSLSLIYSELATRSDSSYSVHISCVEIYNEAAYDLLAATRDTVRTLEDLQRVQMLEDADAAVHLRNLSVHRANTEEEALNLLFLADTNRATSETPMNLASSRSHCLFTITMEARQAGSDIVRKAKLNLVDLAGSERVSRTNSDGVLLKEAKYINLSLHYLEQVIIALQERSTGRGMLTRPHVPYRNSLLTAMLKDSLGGNCATAMLATISTEASQLEESIATCRFAQRVALITNEVSVNEEVDPALVVERLKVENAMLKSELKLLRGEGEEDIGPDQLQQLRTRVDLYLADRRADLGIKLDSMRVVQTVIALLRDCFVSSKTFTGPSLSRPASGSEVQRRLGVAAAEPSIPESAAAEATPGSEVTAADGKHQNIAEEHRSMFLERCQEAKSLGQAIGSHKREIERLKAAMRDGNVPQLGQLPLKDQIEQETQSYKDAFNRLRDLKPQVEQLQSLLNRHRSQTDAAAAAPDQLSAPEGRDGIGTGNAAQQSRGPTDVNSQDAAQPAAPLMQLASASRRASAAAVQSPVDDAASSVRPQQADTPEDDTRPGEAVPAKEPTSEPTAVEPPASSSNNLPLRNGYQWGGAAYLQHRSGSAGSSAGTPIGNGTMDANSRRQPQPANDFSHVDPEVMAQAQPLLTGNVVADRNIVRFYEARAQLLRRQQALT